MYCTDPETLTARKVHLCQSCGERVNPGEQYMRWRCYDGGDVGTVKMHPECHAMHCADAEGMGGGPWEFTPFDHDRPTRPGDAAAMAPSVVEIGPGRRYETPAEWEAAQETWPQEPRAAMPPKP